jgi:hypothetical protein
MSPEHVLLPHPAHSFIINVQPSFTTPATAVFVRVYDVDRIVPAARRLAMVVKHPIELVAYPLRRFSVKQVPWFLDRPRRKGFLALANTGKQQKENNTERNVELRRELNRLADLNYAIRGHVIQEALTVRWRTRTRGSTSMCTCWIASLELDWPASGCTGWGSEMFASAS